MTNLVDVVKRRTGICTYCGQNTLLADRISKVIERGTRKTSKTIMKSCRPCFIRFHKSSLREVKTIYKCPHGEEGPHIKEEKVYEQLG